MLVTILMCYNFILSRYNIILKFIHDFVSILFGLFIFIATLLHVPNLSIVIALILF